MKFSARTTLVPTATTRLPRARVGLSRTLEQMALAGLMHDLGQFAFPEQGHALGHHFVEHLGAEAAPDHEDIEGPAATGQTLGRADAPFVKSRTGFSIGGVAPVAHAGDCVTLIDRELFRFDVIWAAAGHPNGVFPLSPAQGRERIARSRRRDTHAHTQPKG